MQGSIPKGVSLFAWKEDTDGIVFDQKGFVPRSDESIAFLKCKEFLVSSGFSFYPNDFLS